MPGGGDAPMTLALFNTLLNVMGVVLIWPFASRLIAWLQGRYKSGDESIGRPAHLDPTLAAVPALALRGLVLEIERMMEIAFDRAGKRLSEGHKDANGNGDAGLLALGQSIRDFIADLSRQSLPPDVVTALPDLIRSVQHVEEAVTESAAISDSARTAAPLESGPAWDRLKAGVLAALVTASGEPDAFKSEFDQEMEEVDEAYQAIKKDLLTSAAAGRTSVEAAEAALLRARRMRRVAEAALKAERRLCPWAPVASGRVENTPPEQP